MSGLPILKRFFMVATTLLACNFCCAAQAIPPTPVPNPTLEPAQTNIISNVVMARDVKGSNYDPVDVTTSFPADQAIFHVIVTIENAPANTAVKAVWLTATSEHMGEFELKSDGYRNIDFTFAPYAGKLPPGDYKVEIYLNAILNQTLNFSVASDPNAPANTDLSAMIKEVIIADHSTGPELEPGSPVSTFKNNDVFHAVVRIQNAPVDTKFKALWYAVDVGSAAAPNTYIDSFELSSSGTRNIDFTLTPRTTWPIGTYRVDISINGTVQSSKTFEVK